MTDTINIPRAELQAALDALTSVKDMAWSEDTQAGRELVDTIRARLAQQEEKPEHELKDIRCECCGYMTHHREHMGCIRAAIKQEEKPEPVAFVEDLVIEKYNKLRHFGPYTDKTPLYAAPPQREWQGLTDEDIWNADEIMAANSECGASFETLRELAHAIESKLKEKNT